MIFPLKNHIGAIRLLAIKLPQMFVHATIPQLLLNVPNYHVFNHYNVSQSQAYLIYVDALLGEKSKPIFWPQRS